VAIPLQSVIGKNEANHKLYGLLPTSGLVVAMTSQIKQHFQRQF
jgi:hypothetical protein